MEAPSATSGQDPFQHLTGRERSVANLRLSPQYRPGQSGNPSGLTKEGLPSKSNKLRTALQRKLERHRERQRFVDSWFEAACAGDSAAREQILKRLDPVIEGTDGAQGKVILQGIRLELAPGSQANVQVGSSISPLPLNPTEVGETSTLVERVPLVEGVSDGESKGAQAEGEVIGPA